MENASKALIIAGAILLAILLISLGIMIFNQASDTVTNSGMSEAELTAFNNKFVKYEGKQKGTMIKSMVQEVMVYNNSDGATDDTRISINRNNRNEQLTQEGKMSLVYLDPAKGSQPMFGADLKNNSTYTVKIKYDSKGRVALIEVS